MTHVVGQRLYEGLVGHCQAFVAATELPACDGVYLLIRRLGGSCPPGFTSYQHYVPALERPTGSRGLRI